jgi:Asp-tRNA(Asn)/Glu-tRNA(Gln) amidotransferase A subunit family amidase
MAATDPPIHDLSAASLARRVREGELSPVTVVDAVLDRVAARNDRTNAFVTVTDVRAREAAREAEAAVEAGEPLGPLHGVPVAIKDLDHVAGVPTTNGSLLFEDFVPDESEPVVERLVDAGAIVVGKTNTPEFGLGCTTHNRVVGPTPTPFDLDRIAGGSSGGAGAALADRLVPVAQGSDTGGSIRTPSACCGVFGLKPTYGRVAVDASPDVFGTHAPFTHLGPMARTVEDAALVLEVMAGPDPADPFSLPADDADYVAATDRPVDDLRIAYAPDLGAYPIASEVRETLDDAVEALRAAGATVERIDGPLSVDNDEVLGAYYDFARVLWESLFDGLEADRGLDPRGADRDRLAESTVETILEAEDVTTRDVAAASRLRTTVFRDIQSVFEAYDLLVTATLAVTPFEIGEFPTEISGEAIDPKRGWLLTQPFNLSGHPAASVPAGLADGLPVGMQVVGPRFDEATVLAASAAVERNRPWRHRYPE